MNADQAMRAHSATLPSPTFPDPAFVIPPALASATVAIVTSAALHTADDTAFAGGDTSFRLIDQDRRDLVLGHWSPNFDRSAISIDLNVVYRDCRWGGLEDRRHPGREHDRGLSRHPHLLRRGRARARRRAAARPTGPRRLVLRTDLHRPDRACCSAGDQRERRQDTDLVLHDASVTVSSCNTAAVASGACSATPGGSRATVVVVMSVGAVDVRSAPSTVDVDPLWRE